VAYSEGSTTTLPAFLDALVATLSPYLAAMGVQVFSAPVDPESMGAASVTLCESQVQVQAEYPTIPMREALETYTVDGHIVVVAPGAGEAAIKAARDKAFAILASIASRFADDSTFGVVRDSILRDWSLVQSPIPNARSCHLTFSVDARAEFLPTL
jgi:hypothetical protein